MLLYDWRYLKIHVIPKMWTKYKVQVNLRVQNTFLHPFLLEYIVLSLLPFCSVVIKFNLLKYQVQISVKMNNNNVENTQPQIINYWGFFNAHSWHIHPIQCAFFGWSSGCVGSHGGWVPPRGEQRWGGINSQLPTGPDGVHFLPSSPFGLPLKGPWHRSLLARPSLPHQMMGC